MTISKKNKVAMKLLSIKKVTDSEKTVLAGLIQSDTMKTPQEVFFRYPAQFAPFVAENGDAFVPALLLPAMAGGQKLEILPPISQQLFDNLPTIQAMFNQWFPATLKRVEVSAPRRIKYNPDAGGRAGAFFSLGVDSFYTLYKDTHHMFFHRPPVSHLIYMKGLESPLSAYRHQQDQAVIQNVLAVAAETRKEAIIGETNIRDCFPFLDWGWHYNGAGLAAVGLSLGDGLGHILVPSSHAYRDNLPWGSSPLMDPLWSTEKTVIVHDGCEADRTEKVVSLARDQLAMRYLRVCSENKGGVQNCGKCEKCLRTMLSLSICGKLSEAGSFPHKLPARLRMTLKDKNGVSFAAENVTFARLHNSHSQYVRQIERQIEKFEIKEIFKNKSFFKIVRLAVRCGVAAFLETLLYLIKILHIPTKGTFKRKRARPLAVQSLQYFSSAEGLPF